jgi:cytochrome o ubiquinol oxidase subunit 2
LIKSPDEIEITPRKLARYVRKGLLVSSLLALSGCDWVLLNPSGDIARQQSDLLITSTWLMLLIVVPVIGMSLWFAWYYRESNDRATYKPDWDHSTLIELYVWAAPLLIIIALGALTWVTTHTLDPFRPLDRVGPDQPVAEETEPLRIQAVALEWKWLFIYPEQGIAVVNELAAPVNRPIRFETTSPALMNSLYIPTLAGMVYAMPGMQTLLHAVINEPGDYYGISGNYSGPGYSDMKFRFHGLSNTDFDEWVARAKGAAENLDTDTYQALAEKSIKNPVRRFSAVESDLYHRILNLCVEPGTMCKDEMMAKASTAHAGHAAQRGEHAKPEH